MKAFVEMRAQINKGEVALEQLDRDDFVKKDDEFDDSLFDFFVKLNEGFYITTQTN